MKQGLGFSPGAKVSYDFTRVVSGGIEYYADYGRLGAFDALHYQQQQIFVVTDLNTSPKWEINIGVGVGQTASTDHLIVKANPGSVVLRAVGEYVKAQLHSRTERELYQTATCSSYAPTCWDGLCIWRRDRKGGCPPISVAASTT